MHNKNKKFKIKNNNNHALDQQQQNLSYNLRFKKIIRLIYHSKYEQEKIYSRQIRQKHRIKRFDMQKQKLNQIKI